MLRRVALDQLCCSWLEKLTPTFTRPLLLTRGTSRYQLRVVAFIVPSTAILIDGRRGRVMSSPRSAPRYLRTGHTAAGSHPPTRGPIQRDEWIRRVRVALRADYTTLRSSPLCDLPGVQALAHRDLSRRIYPTAAAVRALLDRAYDAALMELDGVEDHRMRHVAMYLQLAREGVPITQITRQLGLRSRSYVHRAIQPQALELVTEAFLRLARPIETMDDAAS